jgi:hypothetical protein
LGLIGRENLWCRINKLKWVFLCDKRVVLAPEKRIIGAEVHYA